MPSFDVHVDPVFEWLSVLRVDYIRKPRARQQVNLFLVRQIQHEIGKLFSFLEHSSYTDILILRTINRRVLVLLDAYTFE